MKWFMNKSKLNPKILLFRNRITVHSNGTLQINDVQESDQGMYNCVGIRGESTSVPQSYTAELKLSCKYLVLIFILTF